MITNRNAIKESLISELEKNQTAFLALVELLNENDLRRRSHNPGWTNGEILAHMTFTFLLLVPLIPLTRGWGKLPKGSSRWFASLLNAATGPFNWINAWGTRGQGRVFTHARLRSIFERAKKTVQKQIQAINDDEWGLGMFYPTHWDFNFKEFMTLEMVIRYAFVHFNFHKDQLYL